MAIVNFGPAIRESWSVTGINISSLQIGVDIGLRGYSDDGYKTCHVDG